MPLFDLFYEGLNAGGGIEKRECSEMSKVYNYNYFLGSESIKYSHQDISLDKFSAKYCPSGCNITIV